MHCFLEKRKLNDSLWILLKCTNVWHVEDSARFLLRATGWEVLLWLLRSLEISSSCWKGSDFFFFFFFGHSWENFTFLKEARSAGWEAKHPACDLFLPIGARPADVACTSPLGQWDKVQLERVARYHSHWLLIPFLSLSHVLRQPRGHHLWAVSLCGFPVSAAGHQTHHWFVSHVQPKKLWNNFSSTYLPWIWTQRWKTFCILLLYPWAILMPWISFFK